MFVARHISSSFRRKQKKNKAAMVEKVPKKKIRLADWE